MNPNYSNDPLKIGKYFSNSSVLLSTSNRLQSVSPFEQHQMVSPDLPKYDSNILTVKPRDSVPEQFIQTETRISKSCNMPGITINRFEHPIENIQNPAHIIANEQFRGGIPSRIVVKDEYINNQK